MFTQPMLLWFRSETSPESLMHLEDDWIMQPQYSVRDSPIDGWSPCVNVLVEGCRGRVTGSVAWKGYYVPGPFLSLLPLAMGWAFLHCATESERQADFFSVRLCVRCFIHRQGGESYSYNPCMEPLQRVAKYSKISENDAFATFTNLLKIIFVNFILIITIFNYQCMHFNNKLSLASLNSSLLN